MLNKEIEEGDKGAHHREELLSLRKAVIRGLFNVVFPNLKGEYPEVMRALTRRFEGGYNDVELGFFATEEIWSSQVTFSSARIAGRCAFCLDLALCNRDVGFKQREKINRKFWQLCNEVFGITEETGDL